METLADEWVTAQPAKKKGADQANSLEDKSCSGTESMSMPLSQQQHDESWQEYRERLWQESGIMGDGVTDDTAAVQRWFRNGGWFLKPGTFLTSEVYLRKPTIKTFADAVARGTR